MKTLSETQQRKKIEYWIERNVIPMKIKREKEETKSSKVILKQLNDEDENTKFEEEVMSLGPCIEGSVRLIKLGLKTQTVTENILAMTYKLRDI